MIEFEAVLEATTTGGGGCLVRVPGEVVAGLGLKGRPRVRSTIAGTPYRGSLMPCDGGLALGVLKAIREARHLKVGDRLKLTLAIDTEARTVDVPSDLAEALARDPAAAAAWAALSYTQRKEIARSLTEAKKAETRARRLESAVKRLSAIKRD